MGFAMIERYLKFESRRDDPIVAPDGSPGNESDFIC
jgi:hypothetical protein